MKLLGREMTRDNRRTEMDSEHYNKLREGRDVWKRWRAANPGICPDLRGADLRGTELHGYDLRGSDFCGIDLRGADPRGYILDGRPDSDFHTPTGED